VRGIQATGVRVSACVVAILAVAALVLPGSASAAFTELAPFDGGLVPAGAFECPGPIAFDPGGGGRSAAVYIEDDCAGGEEGAPEVYAYSASGSSLVTSFADDGVLQSFSYESNANECFYHLDGAAVDPATGDLYVADDDAPALFDFNDAGSDLAQLGDACGESGGPTGPFTFASPEGLAVYDGNLYVADGGAVKYTALGLGSSNVGAITLAPNDPEPVAVAVDPNTGNVFVLDGEDDLVDEYGSAGNYLGVFATGFGSSTFSDPDAIAVDPLAHVVYVADGGQGVVDTFDEATGAALLQTPERSGYEPDGVALDTTNHVLYVPYTGTAGAVEQFAYTPAPACSSPSAATKGGVATTLALSCTDASAATVTYEIASNPGHGTLSGFNPATGAVTYTPDPGYAGTDTFTYTGSSVDGTSDPITVSVAVSGPTCAPETLTGAYQAPLALTLACSDSSSPVASYEIVSGPKDGSLTSPNASGALTYAPTSIFEGTDSFTYEGVSANGQTSAPTTVTIYVGEPLPPPVEGQNANIYHASGTVTILLPGQTTPIPLTAGFQAPLGSIIQTTNGEAGVFVEINGVLQGANFFNGEFKLTQTPDPHTVLHLLGHKIPKVRCAIHPHSFMGRFTLGDAVGLGSTREALLARVAKEFRERGKPTRQLWGNGHGNYTMVGNGSSASVRGTEWAVFDYPDGTLTFDYTDSVSVLDFHLHKSVLITAGHFYFAALGTLPRCK